MFFRFTSLFAFSIAFAVGGINSYVTNLSANQNETAKLTNNTSSNDIRYTWSMWSLVIVMIGIVLSFIGFCIALCLFMKLENPDSSPSNQKPVKVMTGNDGEKIDEKPGGKERKG